jgi:hypothetical protein
MEGVWSGRGKRRNAYISIRKHKEEIGFGRLVGGREAGSGEVIILNMNLVRNRVGDED